MSFKIHLQISMKLKSKCSQLVKVGNAYVYMRIIGEITKCFTYGYYGASYRHQLLVGFVLKSVLVGLVSLLLYYYSF